ncbi:MAG: magnesium transporter [Planctomycetota bacterium]|jgi:magnesium transporter
MTAAAAIVVLLFEDLIRENPILAFVMPVIAALVGNAGHQALAVTLRGIVLEEVRRDIVGPLVVREMLVGLLNGTLLGIAMALAIAAIGPWVNSDVIVQIGVSAGLATMAAMTIGTLAGSSVPLVMRHLGFDPAHASAIVLIMITDAVSFGVLLGLAWLIV